MPQSIGVIEASGKVHPRKGFGFRRHATTVSADSDTRSDPRTLRWRRTSVDITVSERTDGIVVVDVGGAVDVYTAAQLRSALDAQIHQGRTRLILDFDDVDFLDSTGLGVLVARLKVVRVQDGWIRLVCSSEKILRVLRITGLDKVFPIVAAVEDAAQNPSASGNTAAAG